MKPDYVIDITFCPNSRDKTVVCTNASRGGVAEILGDWLLRKIENGALSERQTSETREAYRVVLFLELEEDTFTVESNTNDEALTLGIMAAVFLNLDRLSLRPLPRRYFKKKGNTMTSDPCNEENRLKQLSINCAWLMEQFDGLQDTLGLDSVATWQDRATAVVRVVRIMAQEQNYLKEAVGKHLREMDQLMRQSSSYERGRRVAQSISALESALDAVKAHNLDKLGCLSVKADKAKVAKAKAPRIKK